VDSRRRTSTLWLFGKLFECIGGISYLHYTSQVWPAYWSVGSRWPNDGEIDIIEGINLMTANQMALHTLPGCTHSSDTNETGAMGMSDCSTPSGCIVGELQPNSYADAFAEAGGGVWATQFDVTGIL
jgi:hypothetical protein